MITELIASALIVAGSLFMLLAAVGVLRLPDLYMRMSATTKASTFGLMLLVMAACLEFEDSGTIGRAIAVVAFILVTTPVSSHMIGRAAYMSGVPLWKHSVEDQMKGYYKRENNPKTGI